MSQYNFFPVTSRSGLQVVVDNRPALKHSNPYQAVMASDIVIVTHIKF